MWGPCRETAGGPQNCPSRGLYGGAEGFQRPFRTSGWGSASGALAGAWVSHMPVLRLCQEWVRDPASTLRPWQEARGMASPPWAGPQDRRKHWEVRVGAPRVGAPPTRKTTVHESLRVPLLEAVGLTCPRGSRKPKTLTLG